MTDENQLKFFISKRENLFGKLQMMYDVGKQAIKDKSKLPTFKIRFSYLDDISEKFEDYNDRICQLQLSLKPDDPVDQKKSQAFEGLFYAIKVMAEELFPPDTSTTISFREKSAQPRLPKIDLPTWDSSLKTWTTFHDKFKALVHDNVNIEHVEKFHYLLQSVSGPALNLIKSLPLTTGNYSIVWDMLTKKYHNKRVLGADILDRLINCPSFSSETSSNLNSFIEVFCDGVTALRAINIPNLADFMLLQIGLQKLPFYTRKQFENHHLDQELPSFDQLSLFLDNLTKVLEISNPSDSCRSNPSKSIDKPTTSMRNKTKLSNAYRPPPLRTSFVLSTKTNFNKCSVCQSDHSHTIYKCPTFLSWSPSQRRSKIRSLRYCFNCLKRDHMRDQCVSKIRCASCQSPHHSLLHEELDSVTPIGGNKPSTSSISFHKQPTDLAKPINSNASCYLSSNRGSSQKKIILSSNLVMLGTAVITIQASSGAFVPVRALIDSGSQVSFITASCAQRLGLTLNTCDVTVAGLAKRLVTETKGITSCIIRPRNCAAPQFTTEAVVLKEITSKMPSGNLPLESFGMFSSLNLADSKFHTPGSIDFLIAADLFPLLFDGQKVTDQNSGLTALHSVFGWVVTGKVNVPTSTPVSSFLTTWDNSEDILKRFWEVEEPPTSSIDNPDDIHCETIFQNLQHRNSEGRYVVPLPFRTEDRPGFDSHSLALKRLVSLERRLIKAPDIRKQYQDFLDEYERLGHMTKVPYHPKADTYFIPHHAVVNSNSATTKLRVVFDGSARWGNEPSLNQLLHIGPKLQADIVSILIRFMFHKFVFVSDICQMYRQILMKPEHRRYQHIIWRRSPDCDIEEFELNTVTYGLTPSPYLALRTIRQLAMDEGNTFPLAVDILLNDVYIDDVISGSFSKADARERILHLKEILKKGGFELRKWSSNCPELLSDIPTHFLQSTLKFDSEGREIIKILGVQWDATRDCFTYQVSCFDHSCTKRKLLSHIARIYDPIGWLAPVTFRLKCLLQHLWRLGIQWDDELPSFITEEWTAHCRQLHALSQVSIPRYIPVSNPKTLKLVGFCDASERGYCGVVYLCTGDHKTNRPQLLLAKSKVAPLKVLSIPRLELCGAVLLTKLLRYCVGVLSTTSLSPDIYAFSDSSTVISWLHTPTYKLKTFVGARVNKIITSLPPSIWYHVVSSSNPADCASRGLQPQQLVEHSLWWKGPPWLSQQICDWPIQKSFILDPDLPELKPINTLNVFHHTRHEDTQRDSWIPLSKFSSLSKLIRVTAWCLRYLSNLRNSDRVKSYGPLTNQELDYATCRIVREIQWQCFTDDMLALTNNKNYLPHLRKLNPFLDNLGCLRVGGRLTHSNLPHDAVHPLILPKKSHFTTLVIDHYHATYLHAGPRILQSLICRKYWILSVRNAIRSRLSRCATCFKCKPIPLEPKMADLPQSRVTPCRPFLNVGVDFGGPFFIKESKRRNAKVTKCYLSLFVCMATKAVHLEAVSDLSTSAFLAALDRFVSRRGLCVNIYTDCGTNFVGAHRHLNELFSVLSASNNYISDYLSLKSINWYFNVPTASHWGGLWEAGIRSTKYHLKRVLKDQVLTFEELATLFSKIEAVLNSRPLCTLSPDPTEINVLTPGHFLTGGPLVAVPEYDVRQENLNRLDRWQVLHRATQHFWNRWSREYLHTLQQRAKWFTQSRSLKEGDIVIMLLDKSLPTRWSLAKVEKLVYGRDGVVRAAEILTQGGKSLLRPLVKLCPLPSQ